MAEVLSWRPGRRGPGDNDLADLRGSGTDVAKPAHPLDNAENRKTLKQLLSWYYYERDRQAPNRLDMAIDHDMYDNLQWLAEHAAEVKDRGQVPLVYNEVSPMVDWILGTERRNRVDWNVLPRAEDDVKAADLKKQVLKYVSDINRVVFNRSRAFGDSIKGGIGYLDDGVTDDPEHDILYSKYEDWRRNLHDSAAYEMGQEDGRYHFRWRWVDEDVAVMMFPDREDVIRRAVIDSNLGSTTEDDEELWQQTTDEGSQLTGRSGTYNPMASQMEADAVRRRVKLIECQFRMPVRRRYVASGPMKGAPFREDDRALIDALNLRGGSIIDRIVMRVHVAVFTESALLSLGESIYRHNQFSVTPIWCYRRNRDRMPYGVIRRVRDIQMDLNKRASKALWLLSTNQVIADKGAVDDLDAAAEEAAMPDGRIEVKPGARFDIRRDTDAATGQIQIMAMDAQAIQKSAGVTQENLGRQTNAVSGKAIEARQNQGGVVVTEPFDNLRLATQIQGQKMLSLVEQWYTEAKVMRITGARGKIEWVRINTPEEQPDGSVRWLNDITSSMADFIVAEQDYNGSLRQSMFDALTSLGQRLPPEVGLKLLTIAMKYSDLPNKDEIADALRKMTGEPDPNKELSPEEQLQAQQQMQAQAEAMEIARQTSLAALEEAQGRAREVNARAAEIEAKAQQLQLSLALGGAGDDGMGAQRDIENAVRQVQERAQQQIDALSQKLAKVQADTSAEILRVNKEADTKVELARIAKAQAESVAEIQAVSDQRVSDLLRKLEDMQRAVEDKIEARAVQVEKAIPPPAPPAPEPKAAEPAPAAAAAPQAPPITLVVQQPEAVEPAKARAIKLEKKDGKVVGATVTREDGSTEKIDVSVTGNDNKKGPSDDGKA